MSDDKKGIPEWLITCKNPYQVMAYLAHEIRFPVTIINGYSELLSMIDQGKADANVIDREKALRAIKNASVYLGEIVSSTLEFIEQQEYENQEFHQLFANLSHDVCTPLSVISGFSELLLMSEASDTISVHEALQAIKNSSERISENLSDMFDIAKYGSDHSEE